MRKTYQYVRLQLKRWAEPELRRIERLFHATTLNLEHALSENAALRRENEAMTEEVQRLKQDNISMHRELAAVKEAGTSMQVVLERVEARCRELEEKNDRFIARIVNLEANAGIMPKFPLS